MAGADYRLCDVCDQKVFYDVNLNYNRGKSEWSDVPPFKNCGENQYTQDDENFTQHGDLNEKYGLRLDYLGDWAVLCYDCSKKFKTVVVPIEGVEE